MSISFPGESHEYRMARNRLLQQEVELRRATEAVAAARRALPPGGVVPQDYVFQQAGPGDTPTFAIQAMPLPMWLLPSTSWKLAPYSTLENI